KASPSSPQEKLTAVMRYDTEKETKEIILPFSSDTFTSLTCSSDGKRLFYIQKYENRSANMMVYDIENHRKSSASQAIYWNVSDLFFHPRKAFLYFSKGQAESGPHGIDLFRMPVNGLFVGEEEPVLQAPGRTTFMPVVSPDCEKMAFVHFSGNSWSYDQELWVGKLNDAGSAVYDIQRLSSDGHTDFNSRFSPDSRYLYRFIQEMSKSCRIKKIDLETMVSRDIFTIDNEIERNVAISPSGYLAFSLMGTDKNRVIMIIDSNGKKRHTLKDNGLDFHTPCFTSR
ncbi:MAG: hypothetical protein ABIK28_17565, partial [Planctomycetota bacterium]